MYKGKTLGQELLDRNIKGSDKSILETAEARLKQNEDALQGILSASTEKIKKSELAPYFKSLSAKMKKTPGMGGEIEQINKVLSEIPKTMTLSEANAMKRNLYGALSDKAFKLDATLATKKDAMKSLASGIKDLLEKKTGDDTVRKLNQELSVFGRARDSVTDKVVRKERNNILGLGNITTGVGGAIAGGPVGAAAAVVGKEILSSTPVKTNVATGLRKAGQLAKTAPANVAKKIAKTSIFKGLSGLID